MAVIQLSDPITDEHPGYEPYVFVCRSPGETERLEVSTLGLPTEARIQEIALSPDGKTLALRSYGLPGSDYGSSVSVCSLAPEVEFKWTVQTDCEYPYFSANGRWLVCAYGTYDSWESRREVQVLSVADGSVVWEKDDRLRDEDNLTDSTGSSMWHFYPLFVWWSLSEPKTAYLVDLSGETVEVNPLVPGLGSPVMFAGKGVVVGVSEGGNVVSTPLP